MKAWHVQDLHGEEQQIIFAENRGKAIYQSEAYSCTGEFIEVRATRASYADDLDNEPKEKLMRVLLENGWWYGCGKCLKYVVEDDNYTIHSGHVYCESCSRN